MPNHIYNIIEFRTKDKCYANSIHDAIRNESNDIDFNKLLSNSLKSTSFEGGNSVYHGDVDWNVQSWGTKWNAWDSQCYLEERGEYIYGRITFFTANTTPYPIFIALSEKYREVRFKVKFADQYAFGCDCGFLVFQNGQEIDRHTSPNEFESHEQYSYWLDIAMSI
ncbi:hypothetical protein [Vibrio navarrensis]|uniref:YubB ferredoxin-like domain-containing protein n=1 Tax=Vibrio navarrensis TaxID=29495 RepID=A0AAJ4LVD7_9VIBR|nr:hypothetical protein I3X05_08035 [Vibrio navarrensis]